MPEITQIGYITLATFLENPDNVYWKIRQVNSVLPVEINLEIVDNTSEQTLSDLVNGVESAVEKLNNNEISYVILRLPSSVIVPWALGQYLNVNTNIYCDKVERWKNMKFFAQNNYLAYKGSPNSLLLIVRNLWRLFDVTSGSSDTDISEIIKNQIYSGLSLPSKMYNIVESGDNAAVYGNDQLKLACKILGIETIDINVRYCYVEGSPYGGLYDFDDVTGAQNVLNEWVDTINKGESAGLSVSVNGSQAGAFTNTMLNTQLYDLKPINGSINTTLYEALNNTAGTNNRFLANNYVYGKVEGTDNPPLAVVQYATYSSPYSIYNNILAGTSGILPSESLTVDYSLELCILETVEYILSDVNGTTDVFSGLQDNRFRLDQETERSRICALLNTANVQANSFESTPVTLSLNKPLEY